jgi:hypothetical protein
MIVRIRFGPGPHIMRKPRKNRGVALAAASLLAPIAVMALVLGLWGLAADLKIAGDFAIPNGLFSHWQVWIASAVVLAFLLRLLNRYGHGEDETTPPAAPDRPRISI